MFVAPCSLFFWQDNVSDATGSRSSIMFVLFLSLPHFCHQNEEFFILLVVLIGD